MRFSERLTQLRTELGITQKELADKLGVSRGAVGMYEIGQRDPDTETIINLTKIFDVTADYLIGISDIRNPYSGKKDKHAVNNFDDTTQNEYFSISELRKFIKEQRKKRKGK